MKRILAARPAGTWWFVAGGGLVGLLLPLGGVTLRRALLGLGFSTTVDNWHFTVAPALGALAGWLWGRALRASRASKRLQAQRAEEVMTGFDAVGTGVYRTALDGRILYANQGMAALFGFPSGEDMRGTLAQSLYVRGEDRAELLRRLELDGSVYQWPIRFVRRDGAEFDASITAHLLSGHILGILSRVMDSSGDVVSICSNCDRVLGDDGEWRKFSQYLSEGGPSVVSLVRGRRLSHGLCPTCGSALFGDLWEGK